MGDTTTEQPAAEPEAWTSRHLWQIQPVRDLMMIAAALLLVYLGYVTRLVTVPLLLAMALAYMFEPLVQRVTRGGRVTRRGATAIIILLATVAGVVPAMLALTFGTIQAVQGVQVLTKNTEWLIRSVERASAPPPAEGAASEDGSSPAATPTVPEASPGGAWADMRDWIVTQQAKDRARTRAPDENNPDASKPAEKGPGAMYQATAWAVNWLKDNRAQIGKSALESGAGAANWVFEAMTSLGFLAFSAFLVAFFFYFFCAGYGKVLAFWEGLIPERRKWRVIDLLTQMDRVIAGFIRGRLTICACLIVFFTAAYGVTGVPGFLILGPIVGLLAMLPYVGGLGAPVAMLLMWLDTSGGGGWQSQWWWIIGAPIGVSLLSQVLDDYVLSPLIQGKNTDMDMPSILFASIAGGILAGVYGLLLAIPAAACINILIREIFWPQFKAWVNGRASDFIPLAKD